MKKNIKRRIGLVLVATGMFFLGWGLWLGWCEFLPHYERWQTKNAINKTVLSDRLNPFVSQGIFPKEIEIPVGDQLRKVKLEYTLERQIQASSTAILKKYKPDFAALVAIEAHTGRIVAMSSFDKGNDIGKNLALLSQFPSASVFKIVTAAAAIDQNKLNSESVIAYNGANHTLYKKNVYEEKRNKWTREISLKQAFAHSINTVFGKVGLFSVGAPTLELYAARFSFNKGLLTDFPLETSTYTPLADDDEWGLVSAASGFNRESRMSPVHAALLASAIANDGKMMLPYMVSTVRDASGEVLYRADPQMASEVLKPSTTDEMKELMRETVKRGTARQSFRDFYRKRKLQDIEVGGKTGSINSDEPVGRCEWFVGYAIHGDRTIAIAALAIHKKYWTIKAATIARYFIEDYFDKTEGDQYADNKQYPE